MIGVSVSGVGLRAPTEHGPMWNALPETIYAELPAALKDQVMFGPEGSFDASGIAASHAASAPALRAELVCIVGTWHHEVHAILGTITVPMHYRQGECDRLWIVDQGEIDGFAAALRVSPRIDAPMMRGNGHCMDFHHVAAALQPNRSALRCNARLRLKLGVSTPTASSGCVS